jgi:hypothetical protein
MITQALLGAPSEPLAQVLLMPWRQLGPGSRWAWFGVGGLGLLAAGLAAFVWDAHGAAILCNFFLITLAIAWGAQISGHFEQNHPLAAKLVPGHVALLRQATLLLWLGLTALTGLLAWASGVGDLTLPLALLLSSSVLALLAVMARWWILWVVIWLAPWAAMSLGLHRVLMPAWATLRDFWLAHPGSGTAAAVMLMGYGLTRLFGQGDPAHVASYRRLDRMRRAQRLSVTGQRTGQGWAAFGPVGEAIGSPFERLPAHWLAHLIKTAQPTERSVMARAEVVLHGGQHWVRHLMGITLALSIILLVFTLVAALNVRNAENFWQHGTFGMAIGLCSASLNPGFTLPSSLWASRREQALLLLVPGMPRGQALNRAVAWRMARHVGLAWVITTAILGWFVSKSGNPLLMCLSAGAAPIMAFYLCRSPARMAAPTAWTNLVPIFAYMVLALVLYAAHEFTHWSVWPMLVASAAISAALGVWRWRQLNDAPSALPAGRLA